MLVCTSAAAATSVRLVIRLVIIRSACSLMSMYLLVANLALNLHVDAEQLMDRLREFNLLHQERAHG